jgi:hypothetical protein
MLSENPGEGLRYENAKKTAERPSEDYFRFFLAKSALLGILTVGCARWGASGALYPKSA